MNKLFAAMVVCVAAVTGVASPGRSAETKDILMVLWRGPTESEAAFKARLAEKGVSANYTELNGEQDRVKLATALREMEDQIAAGKFGVVYSYGTTVTQVVKGIVDRRAPVVFNIVFDPIGGGLVKSLEVPGEPITGVRNGVPIAEQFEALSKVAPLGNVAVLFNAREPNSNIIEAEIDDWAQKKGVQVTSVRVAPNTDKLDEAIADLEAGRIKADTLYLPADTYLASVAEKIVAALGKKLRIYGGTETFVLRGALAAYTPEVSDMGRNAADIAARVLAGEDPAKIPVILPQPKLFFSKAAAANFGLAIPAGAVERK